MKQLKPKIKIESEIKKFIFRWHEFPLDYWWRKKYNIPFGSQQHREMNFIDMCIEYQEELLLKKSVNNDEDFEIDNDDTEVVKLSNEEIDEDYNSLDLSQFD
jgi:hypothetical protein